MNAYMPVYLPEGLLINSEDNRQSLCGENELERSRLQGKILEGRAVVCDENNNLWVDLGGVRGLIRYEDTAVGINDGTTREIAVISRVGRPVAFKIIGFDEDKEGIYAVLSRRIVQEEALEYMLKTLMPGTIIPAKVTHLENFGAFVDIGCGIISLINIENISVSRISHPADRFHSGMDISAVVLKVDSINKRIFLTHKELLGTWEENAALFQPGCTVEGIVRNIESYGIFVELMPNLSGLSEYKEGFLPDQPVSVYVKSVLPDKMKIKLIIIDKLETGSPAKLKYFIKGGRLSLWQYSPPGCLQKKIETRF